MRLFLGKCVPPMNDSHQYLNCTLKPGTISGLEQQLKTRLDRTWLYRKTRVNREDDAASRLFNGVHHIYNRIDTAMKREQEVVRLQDVPENIVEIFDKVMEYKADN